MAKFKFIDPDEQSQDPFANETQVTSEFESMLLEEKDIPFGKKFKTGDVIAGTVALVGQEFVFVDLGGKNSGSIACDEFLSSGSSLPKIGDRLTAYVRQDNGSEIVLTRSIKRGDTDDLMLRNAYDSKMPIEAKIEKVIKGGFEASIGAKRCFVPLSGMDLNRIENPDIYVGGVFQFHIIEFKGRNIVLSRKSLLREEKETQAAKILELIEEGQTHKAVITRITDFGVFASINGLEGLIAMSQLSNKRVKDANEVVKVGENVTVRILKIEKSPRIRVALSLKDGSEDSQWKEYNDKKVTKSNSSTDTEGSERTHIFASAFSKAKKRT